MSSVVMHLVLSMCSHQPSDCFPRMKQCYELKVSEISACETKYPNGMTIDDVYADMSCTLTLHDWSHASEEEILDYCGEHILVDVSDSPIQQDLADR